MLGGFWCHKLFLAARTAEEVIPHYAQQLRERVQPDMITLGSLSLQQVRATKRNICVIIPYSPAHQPCPLCCISVVWLMDRVCASVHVHLSGFLCLFVCWLTNFPSPTPRSLFIQNLLPKCGSYFVCLTKAVLNLSCEISFCVTGIRGISQVTFLIHPQHKTAARISTPSSVPNMLCSHN